MVDVPDYLNTYPELFQNNRLDYLINAKNLIKTIKQNVEETDIYYEHIVLENNPITDNAISIVMTASNRSKQTYFTLDTISHSLIKDIQVIIVDDSNSDPLTKEKLELKNSSPFTNRVSSIPSTYTSTSKATCSSTAITFL